MNIMQTSRTNVAASIICQPRLAPGEQQAVECAEPRPLAPEVEQQQVAEVAGPSDSICLERLVMRYTISSRMTE